jgi:hypothetical protein
MPINMIRLKEFIPSKRNEHKKYTENTLKNIERYIYRCKRGGLRSDLPELERDYEKIKISRTILPIDGWFLPGKIRTLLIRYNILSLTENPLSLRKNNTIKAIRQSLKDYTLAIVICPPYDINIPHLGVASVASSISKLSNERVKVIDMNTMLYNLSSKREFWDIEHVWQTQSLKIVKQTYRQCNKYIQEIIGGIVDSGIDILGVSINASNALFVLEFLRDIKRKKPGIKIIAGGPHTMLEEFHLDHGLVDYRIVGEGEIALLNIIEHIRTGKGSFQTPVPLPGKDDTDEVENYKSRIADIDSIPYPTFNEFDLGIYKKNNLPAYFSRGCINRCTFCYDWVVSGSRFKHRSPEKIVTDLENLRNTHKINYFCLNDLLCNGDLKKLERLCDLLIEKRLGILWQSYALIRADMSERLFDKLRKAGCVLLHYGIDSGSDKILKLMNKGYTSKDTESCIQRTHAAGIKCAINIIVGYPGETEKEFNETVKLITDNRECIDLVGNLLICSIRPKTVLNTVADKLGIDPESYSGTETYKWQMDGNDAGIREKRFKRMMDIFDELGIPIESRFVSKELEPEIVKRKKKVSSVASIMSW